MNGRHWTRNQTVTHWLFWIMMPAIVGQSAFGTAFFFHQVHFSDVNTWTHLQFVALIPIYPLVSIGSMVISGILLDRLGTPRLIPFYQVPMVAAFICFGVAQSLWGVAMGLFFMGLTSGANATLPNSFWAEFYGTKHLGSIKAAAAAAMVFGSAIGPFITGFGIDAEFTLGAQYSWVAVYFLANAALLWTGVRWAKPLLSAPT